jgi:hypothetical protein
MVLLGHLWTWGKKKIKKNPATFLLTRQPRAINLSPMQARKIADCAKSRPGTHPSQIRETKDRPDSNGSVGSLLDLGQKKKPKKNLATFHLDDHGQNGQGQKERKNTKKKKKKIPKPKGDPPGPLESAWPSVSLV